MPNKFFIKILIAGIASTLLLVACSQNNEISTSNLPNTMKISSPSFEHNQNIPSKFTCQGEDISPALDISEIPSGTQSMALIVDDPDAANGNWVHWVVWDIPADTSVIPENIGPSFATQGTTSFGEQGFGGPCPPSGSHRYFFKIYALDSKLDLPSSVTKSELLQAMKDHVLDSAELIGTYQKS